MKDWLQYSWQYILHPRVSSFLVSLAPSFGIFLQIFSKSFWISSASFHMLAGPPCQLYLTRRFHNHILRCIVQIFTKCWKAPGKHLQPSRGCWSVNALRKTFAEATGWKDSVPAKPGDLAAHGVSKSSRSPPGVVLLHQVNDARTRLRTSTQTVSVQFVFRNSSL